MDNQINTDLFCMLIRQLSEGVIITDPNGVILFVNQAAEQIRNISAKDLLGHNAINCHAKSSAPKVERAISFLQSNPDKTYHRMVNDEANQKIYENTYTGIVGDDQETVGLAIITRDVTKAVKADEARAYTHRTQEIIMGQLKNQYQDLLLNSMEMLTNLLETKDQYTDGHSKRVAMIAGKLYQHQYGIDEHYLDILWAAKLHDIGKICIPDNILHKKKKLTASEYSKIKKHSRIASDIIKTLDTENRITPSILHHHEQFGGSGYPLGLTKKDIPLGARIISIADAYDAMRSVRSYRDAMSFDNALDEISRNSGTQFDPEWVEIFIELARTGSIG